jgi:hypothetical protein
MRYLFLSIPLVVAACAGATQMGVSPRVPAASGELDAKTGDNGNLRLDLKVHNLAPPDKVSPGASTYVVWLGPAQGGSPQNLGALRVDSKLNGELHTVTSQASPTIFVTAEPNPTVSSPSGEKLLWARLE